MPNFDFDREVIQKSFELPVLVDFWAPWCGPCRVLGPVLEQLADDNTGRWTLVKVNTEEETGLGSRFNIRSIPNVKLFSKGKEVAEFLGALPRRSIEDWLAEHLPDERKDELENILNELWENADEKAITRLSAFVEANPDLIDGRLALAGHLLFNQPEKASSLVASIKPGTKWHEEAEAIDQVARLLTTEIPEDTPAGEALSRAAVGLGRGEVEHALQELIQATILDKSFLDDMPRKATIALFKILGDQHEFTRKYRRRFDMALY